MNTEINLLKLQNNCTGKCLDFIRDHDFKYYETEEMLRKLGKIEYSPFTYISKVYALKTMDEVVQWYKNFCDALIEARVEILKKKHQEELAQKEKDKLEKEGSKKQEEFENFSKETKKNEDTSQEEIDRLNKEKDKYKEKAREEVKKDDSPVPTPTNNPTNNDDDDWKKKFIGDIEMDLVKKNISQERLNKRLGASDWKEKINGASNFHEALSRRSDLWDIISKLEYEFTCANCGVKKEEYTTYEVESKKCCSYDCKEALKNKNKGIDKDDAKEIKKELQEIKDYLRKNNNDAMKVLNNLLTWMKKEGVINITLSNDKIVVELSGRRTKTIEESDLTSEQRQAKSFLQNSSGKKSIGRSEVEKMVSGNYNEEGGKNKKDGNGGIIAAIVIVRVVLAVIIGVVIHNNKKRDY